MHEKVLMRDLTHEYARLHTRMCININTDICVGKHTISSTHVHSKNNVFFKKLTCDFSYFLRVICHFFFARAQKTYHTCVYTYRHANPRKAALIQSHCIGIQLLVLIFWSVSLACVCVCVCVCDCDCNCVCVCVYVLM